MSGFRKKPTLDTFLKETIKLYKGSMFEKLVKEYNLTNYQGGYVVGFLIEKDEIIQGQYDFPEGSFRIRTLGIRQSGNYIHWQFSQRS